jgi:hypothetical protein
MFTSGYSNGECFFAAEWIEPITTVHNIRGNVTVSLPAQPHLILEHIYGPGYRTPIIRGRGTDSDCVIDNTLIKRWNTGSVIVLIVTILAMVVIGCNLSPQRVWRAVQHCVLCCCAYRLAGYDGGGRSSSSMSTSLVPVSDPAELESLTFVATDSSDSSTSISPAAAYKIS